MSEKNFLSKSLLRSFIPLGLLSDEQLDLLVQKSDTLHFYKGQTVVRAGDGAAVHFYLLHGSLALVSPEGDLAIIQAGDALSYQPIAHEFPRKKTVLADSDCSVLKIDSSLVENLLCWGQVARCLLAEIASDEHYSEDYVWIKKLLESRLFFKIPPINIRKILDKFAEITVKKGEKIIVEGDEGTSCYLVKSGKVEVFIKKLGDKPVAVLEPGAVFGEDALVTNNLRNASIVMQTDGVLMRLEKMDFYQLLAQPVVTMVTPANVDELLQSGAQLLDVRTQKEFELGHHSRAINLPLHLVYLKSLLLDKNKVFVTYSSSEERAKAAAYFLNEQGFKTYALQSGINALYRDLAATYNAL